MKVTMYSRQFCPYCVRAKRLLDELQVDLELISVDGDRDAFERMKASSGRATVPQIWIGEEHIGGCDELLALHRSGQLNSLVLA